VSTTGPAAQTVREIIEASRYLVLAIADAAGRPWRNDKVQTGACESLGA